MIPLLSIIATLLYFYSFIIILDSRRPEIQNVLLHHFTSIKKFFRFL